MQNFGRGSLLLQRFREFARALLLRLKQPHVLDGEGGLIGKGRQKGDVLLLERSHLRPENDDCAKRPALPYQRHGKEWPVPMPNRKFSAAREVVTSILQVDDVDRLPVTNRTSRHRGPMKRYAGRPL